MVRREDLSTEAIDRLAAQHYDKGRTPEQSRAFMEVLAAQNKARRLEKKLDQSGGQDEHAQALNELAAAQAKVRMLAKKKESEEGEDSIPDDNSGTGAPDELEAVGISDANGGEL